VVNSIESCAQAQQCYFPVIGGVKYVGNDLRKGRLVVIVWLSVPVQATKDRPKTGFTFTAENENETMYFQ